MRHRARSNRPHEIRVHFSEKVAGAIAAQVPIAITPKVHGTWRWLDAQTLAFEPGKAFLPATTYQVELFAAFRSARGEQLAEGLRWTFCSGRPQLLGTWPEAGNGEAWPRSAPILLAFDRAIDIDDLLGRLRFKAANQSWQLRTLDADQRAKVPGLRQAAERWPNAHLVALKAAAPLPSDTEAMLAMAVGDALPDEVMHLTAFRTQASFSQAELSCFWAPAPHVRAELAIDALISRQHFSPEDLQFEPELRDRQIALVREERGDRQGRTMLVVSGQLPEDATALKATLRAGVRDDEGVSSSADLSALCQLPAAVPRAWPATPFQTSSEGKLAVHATAALELEVRAFPMPDAMRAPLLLFAEQVRSAVVAFAVSAEDGRPLPEVEIRLIEPLSSAAHVRRALTDAQGIARFEDVTSQALAIEAGAAVAPIAREPPPTPQLLSPILAHRPGDELRLSGIVFPKGEARGLSIEMAVPGSAAARRAPSTATLDAAGRFQWVVRLPIALPDGAIEVRLQPLDARGRAVGRASAAIVPIGRWQRASQALHLEAISAEVLSDEPLLFQIAEGDDSQLDTALDWHVASNTAALSFDDLPGFVFGDGRRPWARPPAWVSALEEVDICHERGTSRLSTLFGSITANARSRDGLPVEVTAQVRPERSRMRPAEASGLVQPAARLVGLRANRDFFRQGEWADIEVVAADLAGQVAPGHSIEFEVFAQALQPWLGGYRLLEKRVSSQVLRSKTVPVTARVQLGERALYRVVACIRDEVGRTASSEIALFVQGAAMPPRDRLENAGSELFFEPGADGVRSGELLVRVQEPKVAAWLILANAEGELWTRQLRFGDRANGTSDADLNSLCLRFSELSLPWPHGMAPVAATLITFDGVRFWRSAKQLFAGRQRQTVAGDLAIQRRQAMRRPEAQVIRDGTPLDVSVHALATQRDTFLIEVRDALGTPVADADVLVTLFDAGRAAEALPWRAPQDSAMAAQICAAPSAGSPDRIYEGEAYRLRAPSPWPARSAAIDERWLRTNSAGQMSFRRGTLSADRVQLHASAFDAKLGRQGHASLALDGRAQVGIRIDLAPFVRPSDQPIARFALDNPLARDVQVRIDLRSAGAYLSPREQSKALTLPPLGRQELTVPLRVDAGATSVALSAQMRALGQAQNLLGRAEVKAELCEERLSGPLPKGAHEIGLAFSRGDRSKRGVLKIEVASESSLARLRRGMPSRFAGKEHPRAQIDAILACGPANARSPRFRPRRGLRQRDRRCVDGLRPPPAPSPGGPP